MDSLTIEEVTEMLQTASFLEDLVASLASKLPGISNLAILSLNVTML